jgi:hypothetical protein
MTEKKPGILIVVLWMLLFVILAVPLLVAR